MREILSQVKKLEISTKQIVDGLITGNYHSVFKGQGIEFSEIREYLPGDDVRAIDWNVTARYDHPFIKEFIEERDLQVHFVFDVSSSGEFGNERSKKHRALELCASLMFAAMRNNDNVGLFLTTTGVEKYIPPRKGRKHVLRLISTLLSYEPKEKGTDLQSSFAAVSKIIKRRSVIFLISDFLSDNFAKPLQIMRKHHDIIAIRLKDEREIEIPDVGLIELEDEETGEQILVDTSDAAFRENYHKLITEKSAELKLGFAKQKIDCIEITTDEPYEVPLKRFFRLREHRAVR